MHIRLASPVITCGKCSSTDIAIPERDANSQADPAVLLRCRSCGHEKLRDTADHKARFEDLLKSATGTTIARRETF